MSEYIEVRTQAELDAALARDGVIPICIGNDWFDVHASGQATVHASEQATVHASEQATVYASEQATVHASGQATVRASEQATVHAWEQATVHAWGQATVYASGQATVRASGQATVYASEQATVRASEFVAVQKTGTGPSIQGGVVIEIPQVETAEQWLSYYGIETNDGIAVLYKAVGDDYVSSRACAYAPGSMPECDEWDPDPYRMCGAGLHFCAAPHIALGYRTNATKYVACPVRVAEIVVTPGYDSPPDKVRAPRVAAPVWEVDIDGERVEPEGAVPA